MDRFIDISLPTAIQLGPPGREVKAQPINVNPTQQYVTNQDRIIFRRDDSIQCFTLFFPTRTPFKDIDEIHSGAAPSTPAFPIADKKPTPTPRWPIKCPGRWTRLTRRTTSGSKVSR